jgi:hypothetical protein
MSSTSKDLPEVEAIIKQGSKKLKATDGTARTLREIADLYVTEKRRAFMAGDSDAYRLLVDQAAEESPIYKITQDNVVSVFKPQEIFSDLYHHYVTASPSQYKSIVKLIVANLHSHATIDLKTVQPVALKDDDSLTWVRLPFSSADIASLTLKDVPEFAHILSLCEDGGESLTLWIGSLLDAKASRVQYLHIQSPGGTGKSALLEALVRVFGNEKVVIVDSGQFNDGYFGEAVEGARILAFPDENSTSFFSSGKFKRFTGEPTVTINPKYKQSRNINLTHKTIVLSNNDVQITSSEADVRRLISVVMRQDNEPLGIKSWYDGLRNSGERILGYCYSIYLSALKRDPSIRACIPVNAALTRKAIERKYSELLSTFYERFVHSAEEADRVRCSEVHKFLAGELKETRRGIFIDNVKSALEGIGIKKRMYNGIEFYNNIKLAKKIDYSIKSVV